MSIIKKLFTGLVAVISASCLSDLAHAEHGVTDTEIRVGRSIALSGKNQWQGEQYAAGADLYFSTARVHGRKIVPETLDDGYDPQRAAANTETLVNRHVFCLFGYMGTPTVIEALKLKAIEQENIPFLYPMTGTNQIRDKALPTVFNMRASYADEIRAHIQHISMSPPYLKSVAVFRQDDSFGEAGLKATKEALKGYGLDIVAEGLVKRNSTDVTEAVEKISAANAKSVMMICAEAGCEAFVRKIHERLPTALLMAISFSGNEALVKELGQTARGLTFSEVMTRPMVPVNQLGRDYLRHLDDENKRLHDAGKPPIAPTYAGLEGFAAAKALCMELEKAGPDLTREKFLKALQNGAPVDIGGIVLNYTPTNHNGPTDVHTAVVDWRLQFVE